MIRCNQGHDNPDDSQFCAVCGSPFIKYSPEMSSLPNTNTKRNLIIFASLLIPTAAILWFTVLKPAPKHNLEVELLVVGVDFTWLGSGDCYSGLTGYWDLREGANVVVSSGSGEILGTGNLTSSGSGVICTYKTTIEMIPETEEGYSINIGNRDPIKSTKDELSANDWKWSLSIGL